MTFPFEKEIVNRKKYSKKNFDRPRFIGYLNNYGEVLSYENPLGLGGHDSDKLTAYFEQYFRMPIHDPWIQEIDGKDVINVKNEQYFAQELRKYFEERVAHITPNIPPTRPRAKLLDDLDKFFYNCYQAKTFMDGFGQNCMALNENEFYQMFCEGRTLYQKEENETQEQYNKRIDFYFDDDYYWYKKHLMLEWYKTVIVQYLQYHLVERCQKGITTCSLKPYETFYNYLLNDFTIHQIPCMMYDDVQKKYVPYKQSQFLVPDSELRLKEEIQAIKKLVPLKKRSKYYR